jgi:hypothetical protein
MRKPDVFAFIALGAILAGFGGNAPQKQLVAEEPQPGMTSKLPRRPAGTNYHIDAIGPVVNPPPGSTIQLPSAPLMVAGWAIDEPADTVAGSVDITIDGVPYAASYGIPRGDVAVYFKKSAFTNSGFQLTIPASLLSPGNHTFTLRVVWG